IACAPGLYVQGRRGDRARRRGAGEGAAASESETADDGGVRHYWRGGEKYVVAAPRPHHASLPRSLPPRPPPGPRFPPVSRLPVPRAWVWHLDYGEPAAPIAPPPSTPSGPRSMIQSAVLITSRLCSMTTTVLPWSVSSWSTSRSFFTSWKCRPVVGSSRM